MSDIEYYEKQKRSDRRWAIAQRVGLVLLLLAVVAGGATLYVRDKRQSTAIVDLGTALNSQRQQTIDCATTPNDPSCNDPVAPPAEDIVKDAGVGPVGPMGPQGPVGPQGPAPTFAQVQNAVDLYCSTGRCNGKSPSTAQVANAVALYCDDRGECRGPAGADGQDGQNGQDGENGEDGQDGLDGTEGAAGPRGPGPSAEQISSAVASYCSNQPGGSCEGPEGPTGPRGPSGNDGTNGQDGEDGIDAVPFTFTFTVPPNGIGGTPTTYTCEVDANRTATCTEQAA